MRNLLALWLFCVAAASYAVVETYEFSDEAHRKRYQELIEELRCPKCQNQNLADSNSPIAADLRRELYRMIEQGDGDAEIKHFMVKRYGNFILYKPPVDKNTLVLWGLPFLLGLFALLFVILLRRRQNRADLPPLSAAERRRLAGILQQYR